MKWDVFIPILIYIFATFAIGLYVHKLLNKRQSSFQEEYFVGGRSLGPIVLAFTLMASSASAGTFIGTPGQAYDDGFSWVIAVALQLGQGIFILGLLGKKFAILSRKLKSITVTDILRERFESNSIVIGSSLGIIVFITAYMIAQFAGGARILESVTGFPYQAGIIIFGVAVVIYTVFGGFHAVALTDAIQGLMMVLGGVIIWIVFMVKTDGFAVLVSELANTHPEMVTLPGGNGTTPTILFSNFIVFGIAAVGMPHLAVRGMTYKNTKSMHRGIILSVIIMGLFTFGFGVFGPVIKALYPNISAPDLAIPVMVLDMMPGWLAGLVLAAPLAAVMSTVDSMLLLTSSTVVKDLYLNYINPTASQQKVSKLSYLVTLTIGTITVLLALTPPDYIQQVVVFSMGGLEATFIAPLLFGLYWKRANKYGGIVSMFTGLISYVVLTLLWPNLLDMDPIVHALILSIASMLIISLISPKPSQKVIQKFWGKNLPEET